jgi:hypothetical protein
VKRILESADASGRMHAADAAAVELQGFVVRPPGHCLPFIEWHTEFERVKSKRSKGRKFGRTPQSQN